MSKQFGILTYHNANNYGAALQAYALQTFLGKVFGKEQVEIIDYKCEGIKRQKEFSYVSKGQDPIRAAIHYYIAINRIRKIASFSHKYMSLSKPIHTREELSELVQEYRYVISGSDQVWNRRWNGGEDTYLQDFYNDGKKKMSYAASFGFSDLPEEWCADYKRLLSDFSHISVREEAGKQIINQLGLKAEVHLDPTLLIPQEDWDKIASNTLFKKTFVLVYMVPYQESVFKEAQQIASKENLDILVVCKSIKPFIKGKYKGTSRVEEILSLFKNAEYVVTNSFHGTAFSIIYKKKFAVVLDHKWGYNIRSAQLITSCRIADLSSHPELIRCSAVDWKQVDSILREERDRTRTYFTSILSGS